MAAYPAGVVGCEDSLSEFFSFVPVDGPGVGFVLAHGVAP